MLIIPQTLKGLTFSKESIVEDAIRLLLCEKLNVPGDLFLTTAQYLPTYSRGDFDEKILKNLYIRVLTQNNFSVITYEEIEASGATWDEVSNFLVSIGGKKLTPEEFFKLK
tara:strand:- start:1065 stop:1397 length:333 start_codon:yes stop_codon:yes gene_type:complete